MKISLIIKLKNEEDSVYDLFKSILNQTRIPNEIIIEDSNSTDNTVPIIRSILSKTMIPYKIIVKDLNIAKGRNLAIKKSKYSLIAVTDGGCELDKQWLSNLELQLILNKVNVVYGSSVALGKTLNGKCFAAFYDLQMNKTSRSVLFTKKAWKSVGGYPEWMTQAGEDSYFFMKLNKQYKTVFEPTAVCYWHHGYDTLHNIYRAHYRYSLGDGESLMWSGRYFLLINLYILSLLTGILSFFLPLLVIPSILTLLILLLRNTIRVYIKNRDIRSFYAIPLINIFRDLGMILGYLKGTLNRFAKR